MIDYASYSLLTQLIEKPSVTPDDAGCQALISDWLEKAGVTVSNMPFEKVTNLWATHGQGAPYIVFAGHTDVVPASELSDWQSPPFTPTVKDGYLYGRGASDMKSGVACMVTALIELARRYPNHPGTIALLLTSDEEGPAIHGTKAVLAKLARKNINVDYAIVGEPTCKHTLGDTARQGRRGSLHLKLTVQGQGGHVAYPEQINNPCYGLAAVAERLSRVIWDQGNELFPPTSFQISNMSAGEGTENVAPTTATFMANWRYNALQTVEQIQHLTTNIIEETLSTLNMRADYDWRVSAEPFITQDDALINALSKAIADNCQQQVTFNTAGGTSDARFLAKYGAKTVEFGPINATIHQANECIKVADIEPLHCVYVDTVINLWKGLNHAI